MAALKGTLIGLCLAFFAILMLLLLLSSGIFDKKLGDPGGIPPPPREGEIPPPKPYYPLGGIINKPSEDAVHASFVIDIQTESKDVEEPIDPNTAKP